MSRRVLLKVTKLEIGILPSGNLTLCHGKFTHFIPFLDDLPIQHGNIAILHGKLLDSHIKYAFLKRTAVC
jgi:hypothetical protein